MQISEKKKKMLRSSFNSFLNEQRQDDDLSVEIEDIQDPFEVEFDIDTDDYFQQREDNNLIDDNYEMDEQEEQEEETTEMVDEILTDTVEEEDEEKQPQQQQQQLFRHDLDLRALNLPAPQPPQHSTIYKGASCESAKMERVLKSVDNLRNI